MTIVVKGEVKRRRQNNSKGTNFLMKGWTLEGVFARNVLQVSRTHFRRCCKMFLNSSKQLVLLLECLIPY